jgi:5-methylcytosine-specific restriction protein B
MGVEDESRIEFVQFHQSYSYEDFVQGWRPEKAGGFYLRNGVFYEFCKRAATAAGHCVFIIDEINRGDLSKIFGELLMLIEPEKRQPRYGVTLTYAPSDQRPFVVPENVFIIGLMNTADRNLAMVDYALRRRFAFVSLEPQFRSIAFHVYLEKRGVASDLIAKIIERMSVLNGEIEEDSKNLGAGFRIGHSFFCPGPTEGNPDQKWYDDVVDTEIAPLIAEYWFDDIQRQRETIASLRR